MILQNEKTPFQAIERRSSKCRKIDIYLKGLTHGFGAKKAIFPIFFFQAIQARKMSFITFQQEKTPFWAIKTRSCKSRKIDIHLKGLTHGFGAKKDIFPSFFFQAIQARKMSFMIFQNEKSPFQAIKTRRSKCRKVDIFSMGLTDGFGPKMAIFPTFFFQAMQARKMSFIIFQHEKTPFQAKKTRSSKSRIIGIFPKGLTDGFGPKMVIFQLFFFRKYRPGKCLLSYSSTKKTPFQAIENKKLQKSKN